LNINRDGRKEERAGRGLSHDAKPDDDVSARFMVNPKGQGFAASRVRC